MRPFFYSYFDLKFQLKVLFNTTNNLLKPNIKKRELMNLSLLAVTDVFGLFLTTTILIYAVN